MTTQYLIRPTDLADAPALNNLYKRLTGISRSMDQWQWEWRDGPFGPAPSHVIVHRETGEIAGHHGVIPIPMRLGARTLLAARTENSMVAPEHRGRFMYPAYEASLLKQFLERYAAVFTTAGGGAQGAIRKRLGYKEMGTWRSFSTSAGPGYVATRGLSLGKLTGSVLGLLGPMPDRGIDWQTPATAPAMAQLWQGWQSAYGLTIDRSESFLQWRLFAHPYRRFQTAILARAGTPFAVLAWREDAGPGGTLEVTVEDIFVRDASRENYRLALRALAARLRFSAARIVVRTLDGASPLSAAADKLQPAWAAGKGFGSPFYLRSLDQAVQDAALHVTMLYGQGI